MKKLRSSFVDSSQVEIVKISLEDGSVLIGQIVSENNNAIVIKTNSGIKNEIPKVEIKKRKIVTDKLVEGEMWESDPNKTRLFFSPTSRALDRSEGYFAIYELFFPFLAVGVTDNLTLSGSVLLFPGADSQLLYVAPKYTFLNKKIWLSLLAYDFSKKITADFWLYAPSQGRLFLPRLGFVYNF